ncbi:Hsp20/alpha crystallin family protein [Gorillibacterium sp. sgz500922]|uniref:Hsp20/alpha crystallin family protein n=1 Tax=Gorillibacterium sp. sgz500922 TaxID=3446694 RepID=UPI003F663A63
MFEMVPFKKRKEDAFSQLARSFNDIFDDEWLTPFRTLTTSFKADIRETDQAYLVEAELPGFKKEEIEIDYAHPYLTIKAVHNEEANEENDGHQVIRRERRYGEYVRRFYVQDIEEEGIRAALKDGILSLEIPKSKRADRKRIEIRDGK